MQRTRPSRRIARSAKPEARAGPRVTPVTATGSRGEDRPGAGALAGEQALQRHDRGGLVARRHQPRPQGPQAPGRRPGRRGRERAEGERPARDPAPQVVAPRRGQPLAGEVDQRPGQRQQAQHHRGPQGDAELEHAVHSGGPRERARHQQGHEHRGALAGVR